MNILQVYLLLILIIFNLINLFLIKFISRKYNLYDEPNYRKQHTKPIPYIGGILFFLSNFFYLLILKHIYLRAIF